jgi:hypothetical protein
MEKETKQTMLNRDRLAFEIYKRNPNMGAKWAYDKADIFIAEMIRQNNPDKMDGDWEK